MTTHDQYTDEDFDFSAPDPTPDYKSLQNQISDQLVVIDTAQSLLRTAAAELKKLGNDKNLISIPSYNWVINWKQ